MTRCKAKTFAKKRTPSSDSEVTGGGPVPPVLEINVGTDVDDTGARLDARIDQIRLAAC